MNPRQSGRRLRDEIMEMFNAFNQVGVTVLVATHDRQLIGKYRKRVLTLDHGKLQ